MAEEIKPNDRIRIHSYSGMPAMEAEVIEVRHAGHSNIYTVRMEAPGKVVEIKVPNIEKI